jgi:hypothetical protein
METLEKLIDEYKKLKNKNNHSCSSAWAECSSGCLYNLHNLIKNKSFRDVIIISCGKSKIIEEFGFKIHPLYINRHANILKNEDVKKLIEFMLKNEKKLFDIKSFHDLIMFISQNQKIYKNAQLTIYDICLRLGAKMNLEPENVYLHAGALRGFKALNNSLELNELKIFPDKNIKYALFEKFPDIMKKQLSPNEIEDFLCIYKDKLANLKPQE